LNSACSNASCLIVNDKYAWLWHTKVAHIHMSHVGKLI